MKRVRRFLLPGIAIALVLFTFAYVLPKVADYGDVWDTLQSLSAEQLALLAAVTIANLATYAPPYQAVLPGIGFRRAFVVSQVASAFGYIAPGGAAVGVALAFAMLRAWGYAGRTLGVALGVMTAFSWIFLLGAPTVALALLTLTGERHALLQIVAIVGLVLLAIPLSGLVAGLMSEQLAIRVGNTAARLASRGLALVRRGPVGWDGMSLASFRRDALLLLGSRWWRLLLATLAGNGTVFLVLLTTLRTLGVPATDVSGIETFAAWSLVRLVGSIPVTPGGIGIVELGLTAALIQFGGDDAAVVAAVLLYRVLTLVPTIVLGAVFGLTWRRYRVPVSGSGSATPGK
jgi:uncharacterized membrane protein YbhN (UPF0104 family)